MATERKPISLSPTGFALILSVVVIVLLWRNTGLRRIVSDQASVVITEFCAHNGNGILDEDGEHSDWIELYNAGTRAVQLEGWYLTDSFRNLTKWRFPSAQLEPGKYTVVFASRKDRRTPGRELHTNFKLKDTGGYLALVAPDGVSIVQDFFPKYPRQVIDISYGLTAEAIHSSGGFRIAPQSHRYFGRATPGEQNAEELVGLASNVKFSRRSGFCEGAFELILSTPTPGTTIYYTTDGAVPTPTNSTRYGHSIPIHTTCVVRAIALAPGMAVSELTTRTYIFPGGIPKQTGAGLPRTWGKQDDWVAPAHYTLSPEIVNDPVYRDRFDQGLAAIPSLSIVTDFKNLFDPETGIYTHTMTNGHAWERPASVELFQPGETTGFSLNCGLRIQGGWNRRPMESPKHSLRLLFKKEYGPTKLNFPLFGTNGATEFDTVILRGGNNNSWLHWNFEERRRGDYLRDEWMRRTFLAMGHPSARGRFVHVYLNGLYWGMYNLCERPSAPFVAANQGGSKEDYESRKAGKILSGDKNAWTRVMALANDGLAQEGNYQAFQELVDLPELTDYLILNFFGANGDWDRSSNWYAARPAKEDGKFQFLVWDGERTLEEVGANSMDFDDDESPPRLFHKLSENPEFRILFADRVQRVLFNGGPLTPEPAAQRYRALAAAIEKAVVVESARWGNYRRDLQQYKVGPYEFYKPDDHWRPEVNRLLSQYFPQRPESVLRLFRERGLYPRVDAPIVHAKSDRITLTTTQGAIYYTLDGNDPRLPGGRLAPSAIHYVEPIPALSGKKLKARAALEANGSLEWSALVEF